MSGPSGEKISNVGGGDDDDEDEHDAAANAIVKKHRTRTVCFGFTKAKRQIRRIRSKRALLLPSSSSSSSTGSGKKKNKMIIRDDDVDPGTRTGSGCRFCFSLPRVLESPDSDASPTGDPNDPNFTHAMFTTLIEKNDFYSTDCNPHLHGTG